MFITVLIFSSFASYFTLKDIQRLDFDKKIVTDQKNRLSDKNHSDKTVPDFHSLWLKLVTVFSFSVLIAILISYYLSKNIEKEIDKILLYLKKISNKNYKAKIDVDFAQEFAEIAYHLKNLAKKLEKREQKKQKYTQRLIRSNRQKSELISAISHEFKNPLAVISGYTQTLLEDDLDKNMREKFIGKIYKNSQKLSDMIDRLAIAVKFENNELTLNKTDFEICDVIKSAAELLKDKYKEREIIFKCQNQIVNADKTLIETVIINLIDNALKYSEDEVTIEVKNGKVKVMDKGIGIKDAEKEKIVKKFYRARRNSWDNSMGLGLYFVSYILNLHESSLKIESEFSKGSIFSFSLFGH